MHLPPILTKTLARLINEFWLAAVCGVGWTIFTLRPFPDVWTWKGAIGAFSVSFFFVSWATGQFFRVRKQAAVDTNLSRIEDRLTVLVETLEARTKDLIGYATGGDSMITITPSIAGPDSINLILMNECQYPVFDIQVEYIDVDEPIDLAAGKFWTRHRILMPALWPHKALFQAIPLGLAGRDRLRINLFIQTRGAGAVLLIRVARRAGGFVFATKFDGPVGTKISVPPEFPGYDPANPHVVFV